MSLVETSRSREVGAWLGALLLHVMALALVRHELRSGGATEAAPTLAVPASSDEFDVEFGEDSQRAADAHADDNEARQAASSAPFLTKRATRATTSEPHPDAQGAATALELPKSLQASPPPQMRVAEANTEAADADAPPATPSQPIDLGIGPDAWRTWARTQPLAPAREATDQPTAASRRQPLVRAPTPSKTGGVQEGLEANDRKRGLGPSGRVVTALHQATHSEVAPQLGVAHFSVTVLRSGEVQVSLNSANGESEKWRAVAERAALALRKAPPRIPPSREGVRLTLDVTAEETFPNGLKRTELHGPQLEAEPPAFQSTEEAQAELEANNPVTATSRVAPSNRLPPIKKLPGVYVTGKGKVCGYRVGLSLLGPVLQGGCDPSNIGAKPQRMVRVAVKDQSFF
jgi:hypothetical protein